MIQVSETNFLHYVQGKLCSEVPPSVGNDIDGYWFFVLNIDAPISKGRHRSDTLSSVDQSNVDTLISFGFHEEIARKVLRTSGSDIEKATDWIFTNPDASVSDIDATTSNPSIANDVGLPDRRGRYRLIGIVSHIGTST